MIWADAINRATAKTQSALLEAMEEDQVILEGHTRPLPPSFFVVATLNPTDQIGTFPPPSLSRTGLWCVSASAIRIRQRNR